MELSGADLDNVAQTIMGEAGESATPVLMELSGAGESAPPATERHHPMRSLPLLGD